MPLVYSDWNSIAWKKTLYDLKTQFLEGFNECVSEGTDNYQSFGKFEHSLVLSAFCIRRIFEKKLVTDKLQDTEISICKFDALKDGFRRPFHISSGGFGYSNYLNSGVSPVLLKIRSLVNEIIHAYQIMILLEDECNSSGIIVVSDHGLEKRALFFSDLQYAEIIASVLSDHIEVWSDKYDPDTKTVHSERL